MKQNKSSASLRISNSVSPQRFQLPQIQLYHHKENPLISIPFSKHGKKSLFPSFHPEKVLQMNENQPTSVRTRNQKMKGDKQIYESQVVYVQKEDQGTEPLTQTSFIQGNQTGQSNMNNPLLLYQNNPTIDNFLHRNSRPLDVAEHIRKLNSEIQSNKSNSQINTRNNITEGRAQGNLSSQGSNRKALVQNESYYQETTNGQNKQKQQYASAPSLQKVSHQSIPSNISASQNNFQPHGASQSLNDIKMKNKLKDLKSNNKKDIQFTNSFKDQYSTKNQEQLQKNKNDSQQNNILKNQSSQSNILEGDIISNNILPSEIQSQNSLNIFRLTNQSDDKKISEHQMNLLQALNMCNTSRLDTLVKENQNRIKEHKERMLNMRKNEQANNKLTSTFNIIKDNEINTDRKSQHKQLNQKIQNYKLTIEAHQDLDSHQIQQSYENSSNIQSTENNGNSLKSSRLYNNDDESIYDQPKNQIFRLNYMMQEIEEQSKFIKEQQSQINYKMFYSHFDDTYQDIVQLISEQYQQQNQNESQISSSKNKEKEIKPRFKKQLAIRPDTLYNIKQIIRVLKLREEKIYSEQIKPDEMIDYMRKRNEIQVILEHSKKIKNLKVVSDLIEKELGVQNERIEGLVKGLIKKFDLEQYQEDSDIKDFQTH